MTAIYIILTIRTCKEYEKAFDVQMIWKIFKIAGLPLVWIYLENKRMLDSANQLST